MILNLIALAVMFLVAVAGAVLLRRHLTCAASGGAAAMIPRCGGCGAAGETFESFACPACGRDVRDVGLVVPRRGTPTWRFWRAVGYSACVAILATLTTLLGGSLLPPVRQYAYNGSLYATLPGLERVEVSSFGRARGGEILDGRVFADLCRFEGNVFTLEIDPRTRQAFTRDAMGKAGPPQNFDEPMVRQWFHACGFDTDSVNGRAVSSIYFTRLRESSDPAGPQAVRNSLSTPVWGALGGSSVTHPPEGFLPGMVIAWSLIWVGGPWVLLRRNERGRSSRATAGAKR